MTSSFVAEPRVVESLTGLARVLAETGAREHGERCVYERCEERAYMRVEWRIVDGEQRLVDGEHALGHGVALAWYCDEHAPKATS